MDLEGRGRRATGAAGERCRTFTAAGGAGPDAAKHRRRSRTPVPRDTPGRTAARNLAAPGGRDRRGRCELRFENVRVPAGDLAAAGGDGSAISQARPSGRRG